MAEYWQKQTTEPLFPDLVWSRPETKRGAGKLLILGGHTQSFAAPAEAYTAATAARIGTVRVILPSSLSRTVNKLFPAAEYAPTNPSGGFATTAFSEFLSESDWADSVLLSGDFGKNSETIALLENFASKYSGQLVVTGDGADFFCTHPTSFVDRPNTLAVLDTTQLQKLATNLKVTEALTTNLGLVRFAEWLHEFTLNHLSCPIITTYEENIVVSIGGRVSTTPLKASSSSLTSVAATAATWWLQTPAKPFEAITSSVLPHKD